MKKRARRWTAVEDDTLRSTVKWGWSDRRIATAMGYSIKAIREHRRMLGLAANGKPGCSHPHSPEARAKIAAHMRKRWQEEPEFRAARLAALGKGAAVSKAARFRPPAKPEDARWYRKLRRTFGVEAARAMLASASVVISPQPDAAS